jgi:hypothetical protein
MTNRRIQPNDQITDAVKKAANDVKNRSPRAPAPDEGPAPGSDSDTVVTSAGVVSPAGTAAQQAASNVSARPAEPEGLVVADTDKPGEDADDKDVFDRTGDFTRGIGADETGSDPADGYGPDEPEKGGAPSFERLNELISGGPGAALGNEYTQRDQVSDAMGVDAEGDGDPRGGKGTGGGLWGLGNEDSGDIPFAEDYDEPQGQGQEGIAEGGDDDLGVNQSWIIRESYKPGAIDTLTDYTDPNGNVVRTGGVRQFTDRGELDFVRLNPDGTPVVFGDDWSTSTANPKPSGTTPGTATPTNPSPSAATTPPATTPTNPPPPSNSTPGGQAPNPLPVDPEPAPAPEPKPDDPPPGQTPNPPPVDNVNPDAPPEVINDPTRAERLRLIAGSRPSTAPGGDVDPQDNPTGPAVGGAPDHAIGRNTLLGGDGRAGSEDLFRSSTGTPSLADLTQAPGDVDPAEGVMTNTGSGPEDDPLEGIGRPSVGLTGTVSRSSSQSDDEEEDDDEEEAE